MGDSERKALSELFFKANKPLKNTEKFPTTCLLLQVCVLLCLVSLGTGALQKEGFIISRLINDGHSDSCEVIAHCSFDLYFSNNEQCQTSFHVFVSHRHVFFGKMSV